MSAAELDELIGERDYTEFLNSRNELFRRKKMNINRPSREEAVRMMAEEPNLIRRPVIVAGKRIILGFNEEAVDSL